MKITIEAKKDTEDFTHRIELDIEEKHLSLPFEELKKGFFDSAFRTLHNSITGLIECP